MANLLSTHQNEPTNGTYRYSYASEETMTITEATSYISDYTPTLSRDSLAVLDGEITIKEVASLGSGIITNKQYIKLDFDLTLSDNEHIMGEYEGPYIIIEE